MFPPQLCSNLKSRTKTKPYETPKKLPENKKTQKTRGETRRIDRSRESREVGEGKVGEF
jgi:hypothetical protein